MLAMLLLAAVFSHPALEHRLDDSPALRKAAQELLTLSDDQVLALIPNQTPRIHHACPACARRNPVPILEQPTPFPGVFDPRHPNQIRCKICNTVFPNAEYPLDRSEVVRNMLGEDVAVPYYLDPKGQLRAVEVKAGQERRYYMQGVIDTARKLWLLPRLTALAQLYQITRNESYARRVVFVLDALAARYPHYLLATDYGHRYASTLNKKAPYGFIETRWGRRSGDDLPADLLAVFDLVAASPTLDSAAKARIREGLFLGPLRRAALFPETNLYGNISPLPQMVDRALVLESPELLEECHRLIRNTPRYSTYNDGMFTDSPGYGQLFRYTFFPGLRKFQGQSVIPLEDMREYFQKVTTVSDKLRLPSGGYVTYHDSSSGFGPTWWSPDRQPCIPLARSTNVLLPGLRHAILGSGEGDKQVQVHLKFGENGVNHGHQDALSFQIYAWGHSLVDDFEYHKSTLRRYAEMTIAHQTVVIDQRNQNRADTGGDIDFYAPLMHGLAAIRVDSSRAYSPVAKQYARTLILNSIDADAPYVVDVFEVAGGGMHDYVLRGSAQHRESLSVSIPMTPMPGIRPLMAAGETWTEPTVQREGLGTAYGLLFDARRAAAPDAFHFTLSCDKPWTGPVRQDVHGQTRYNSNGAYKAGPDSWKDNPAIGTRHHVAVTSGYELIAAASPSLTESGFEGLSAPSEKWPRIPHVILRHRSDKSVFVVVHEPYHHAPKIKAVTRLKTDDGIVALRIEFPGRVDTLVYALDRQRVVSAGGIELNGRLGLISGKRAYLIEGTRLNDLTNPVAAYAGNIESLERRWDGKGQNRIAVNAKLPEGKALSGNWITIPNGTFEIDRVAHESGRTWVYLQSDHGLVQEGTELKEFYFPRRTFSAPARFRIVMTASR